VAAATLAWTPGTPSTISSRSTGPCGAARGRAAAIGASVDWIANFALIEVFPAWHNAIGLTRLPAHIPPWLGSYQDAG
jgi:hypothetical protein